MITAEEKQNHAINDATTEARNPASNQKEKEITEGRNIRCFDRLFWHILTSFLHLGPQRKFAPKREAVKQGHNKV